MIPLPFSFLLHASFIFVITRFFDYRGEFGNFFFFFFFGELERRKQRGDLVNGRDDNTTTTD